MRFEPTLITKKTFVINFFHGMLRFWAYLRTKFNISAKNTVNLITCDTFRSAILYFMTLDTLSFNHI
jgi:hypothetical protein